MLTDVSCHCKMTEDGVTSFCRLKDITNTCECMRNSPTIAGFLQCNGRKLEGAEGLKCVFVVYCVLYINISALVRELLSINSPFVGQLYEDKSLVLCTHDLIFTKDLQTVNYYSDTYSLLEVIYFLNVRQLFIDVTLLGSCYDVTFTQKSAIKRVVISLFTTHFNQ